MLSSPLSRIGRGGTPSTGPGLHHSVTFVTGALWASSEFRHVGNGVLLGRSQGCRQLLGFLKSCGLTLRELCLTGLYCAQSQSSSSP